MIKSLATDVEAPIVPHESLGGFVLRSVVNELAPLLQKQYIERLPDASWYSLLGIYEARYDLGPVEIGVDVRSGRVLRLVAKAGYRGRLLGKLAVGMRVADAMALDERLYWDDAEEVLLLRGIPGVALDVSEGMSGEAVHSGHVEAITVSADEILGWDSATVDLPGRGRSASGPEHHH